MRGAPPLPHAALGRALLVAGLLLGASLPGVASAGLIGDLVFCHARPLADNTCLSLSDGTSVAIGMDGGPELVWAQLSSGDVFTLDLQDSSIELDFLVDFDFGSSSLQTVQISLIDMPIQSVAFGSLTGFASAPTNGDLSHTSSSITYRLNDTSALAGARAVIEIEFELVPEPSALALLAAALCVATASAARARSRAAR